MTITSLHTPSSQAYLKPISKNLLIHERERGSTTRKSQIAWSINHIVFQTSRNSECSVHPLRHNVCQCVPKSSKEQVRAPHATVCRCAFVEKFTVIAAFYFLRRTPLVSVVLAFRQRKCGILWDWNDNSQCAPWQAPEDLCLFGVHSLSIFTRTESPAKGQITKSTLGTTTASTDPTNPSCVTFCSVTTQIARRDRSRNFQNFANTRVQTDKIQKTKGPET